MSDKHRISELNHEIEQRAERLLVVSGIMSGAIDQARFARMAGKFDGFQEAVARAQSLAVDMTHMMGELAPLCIELRKLVVK